VKQEKYEQKGKSAKIVSIVILGIILALLLVIIVLVMISQNTGSLSEDKMQENAELAEKFQQEGKENVTESEFYTKKFVHSYLIFIVHTFLAYKLIKQVQGGKSTYRLLHTF